MRSAKISWQGELLGIQPRIRLTRSFDERTHTYLGYALRLAGRIGGEQREFSVGIGPAAQAKHGLRAGDRIKGIAQPVADERLECVELYKASALEVLARGEAGAPPPPWLGLPPALAVYRERGHRRLDARTYDAKCSTCQWGCRMPVEMVIDQWNPRERRHRVETFCYGPKSCPLYRPGATRKVPGRNGMSWEEADWVDEDATAGRGPED
jgi:hypothetical protein